MWKKLILYWDYLTGRAVLCVSCKKIVRNAFMSYQPSPNERWAREYTCVECVGKLAEKGKNARRSL